MESIRKTDTEETFIFAHPHERDVHIEMMCKVFGYVCTSIKGDRNNLQATFRKAVGN